MYIIIYCTPELLLTTNNDLSATHTHAHICCKYYALQCTKCMRRNLFTLYAAWNARQPYSFAIELCLLIRHAHAHMDTDIDTHARTHIKRTNESNEWIYILTKVLYTIHSLSVCVFFSLLTPNVFYFIFSSFNWML